MIKGRIWVNSSDKSLFYTVLQPVGEGGVNDKEDVLLVQFFLRVATDKSATGHQYLPPGDEPLKVDGFCGPVTKRFIWHFQKEVKSRFNLPLPPPDGRVDPLTRPAVNTMALLNGAYRTRLGKALINDSPHATPALIEVLFKHAPIFTV
jgi:hypothetical protein